MLSADKMWFNEEERIEVRKRARKIIQQTQEMLRELNCQPANKIYVGIRLDSLHRQCNEIQSIILYGTEE